MMELGDPPRFDFQLNIRQPIDQDAYEVRLRVSFVTFDPSEIEAVPQEDRAFLTQWLMDHTTETTAIHQVSGLEVARTQDPKQLFEHVIGEECSVIANSIFEGLRWQMTSEDALAKEMPVIKHIKRTTYPHPDSL